MNTKTIIVALATLLIGSLCFQACQKDEILSGKPDMTEHIALKSGLAETVTDGDVKMVPFRGSGTWQYAAEPGEAEDEDVLVFFIAIEGTATHLGRLQGYETAQLKVFWMEDGLPVPYAYVSEYTIFTAANGDEMHFEGCAVEYGSELILFDDGSGFSVTGVQLVGGTGRFENAEGWYDIWVTFSAELDGTGTWEIEGEISSVGSTRRGR